MKTKLISLLIALLCMTMLLVSCTDPCVEHIDADKDGICDIEGCEDAVKEIVAEAHDHKDDDANGVCDVENCGAIMIVNTVEKVVEIIVPTTPEEKVDMIVNSIPVDAKAEDYINLDYAEKQAYFNKLLKSYNTNDYYSSVGTFVLIKKSTQPVPNPEKYDDPNTEINEANDYKDIYTVVDISGETELVILTHTTEVYERYYAPETPDFEYDYTGAFISVSYGNKADIYKAGVANTAPMFKFSIDGYYSEEGRYELQDYAYDQYVTYFTFGDVTYAYDNETYELLAQGPKDLFVKRPVFDEIRGNVGYFYDDESMQVYDLTKWIECVYIFEVSNYADESEVFELANGTYLYQSLVVLPDNAVSYDYMDYEGNKYDLVYEIVNPETKTATTVEFGYAILDQYAERDEFKTDGKNFFAVYTIENGTIGGYKFLITDNELNILYEIKNLVVNQNEYFYELKADNYAVVTVALGNGSTAKVSVNLATGAVTYLPTSYTEYDTCFRVGNAFYNYDGTKKIDFAGYNFEYSYNTYVILSKQIEQLDGAGLPTGAVETRYYYYDVNGTAAPVQLQNYAGIRTYADMFVVTVAKTAQTDLGVTTVYEYHVYNSNGVLVTTITDAVTSMSFGGYYEDEGICVLNVTTYNSQTGYSYLKYFFTMAAPAA